LSRHIETNHRRESGGCYHPKFLNHISPLFMLFS
jgi:hypothetical protein